MNDRSPSRLEMLHFARRIAEQQLTQIDRWIAAEERREAERQHGIAARPPAPDWLIEHGLSGQDSMYVHTGDCWNAGKRSKGVTRDTALRALTEGGAPACPHCRPDTALGILEGLFRRRATAARSPTSTASARIARSATVRAPRVFERSARLGEAPAVMPLQRPDGRGHASPAAGATSTDCRAPATPSAEARQFVVSAARHDAAHADPG
ncbi:DUF6233 domain-containing protein [Streptomyces mirabilis]|uniref:DUF6233 domain-containing protein n=1 Tax=Streptomyces mirabilis TaxID=68239 RepID=UPI00331D36DA